MYSAISTSTEHALAQLILAVEEAYFTGDQEDKLFDELGFAAELAYDARHYMESTRTGNRALSDAAAH